MPAVPRLYYKQECITARSPGLRGTPSQATASYRGEGESASSVWPSLLCLNRFESSSGDSSCVRLVSTVWPSGELEAHNHTTPQQPLAGCVCVCEEGGEIKSDKQSSTICSRSVFHRILSDRCALRAHCASAVVSLLLSSSNAYSCK